MAAPFVSYTSLTSTSPNEAWLAGLQGPHRDRALADLRQILVKGLRIVLAQRASGNIETLVEDFVQEALLKILDNLDTFRGESRFTTWSQKIAVRIALSEMRKKRWNDLSLQDLTPDDSSSDYTPPALTDTDLNPEDETSQQWILEQVGRAMEEDLTERQRTALASVVIQGMPLDVVAEQMNTNRNALYKLVFDARKRLKKALEQRGLSPEMLLREVEAS